MSDTTTGTFTLSGATYPAQFTEGKIVDPDGFPYQKGSVKFAAPVEESQPKKKKIVGIKYDDGTVHGEIFPVWKALHDKIEHDRCRTDLCSESYDPLNATERQIFNNLSEKFATLTRITSITESEQ